jgi:hypothetical protein
MMVFDDCYISFLRSANLLAITNIVSRGMPETHSFHLPCSKMMVTLEDVAMILVLPIKGQTVTSCCEPAGLHDRFAQFLGRELCRDSKTRRGVRPEFVPHGCVRSSTYAPRTWTMLQCITTLVSGCGTCLRLFYFQIVWGTWHLGCTSHA